MLTCHSLSLFGKKKKIESNIKYNLCRTCKQNQCIVGNGLHRASKNKEKSLVFISQSLDIMTHIDNSMHKQVEIFPL